MDTFEDRMNAIAASKAMQAAQTFGALLYPGGVLSNVANQGYFNNLIDPIKQLRNSQLQAAAEYAAQVAPSSQPAPAVVASAPQATQEVIPLPDQSQESGREKPVVLKPYKVSLPGKQGTATAYLDPEGNRVPAEQVMFVGPEDNRVAIKAPSDLKAYETPTAVEQIPAQSLLKPLQTAASAPGRYFDENNRSVPSKDVVVYNGKGYLRPAGYQEGADNSRLFETPATMTANGQPVNPADVIDVNGAKVYWPQAPIQQQNIAAAPEVMPAPQPQQQAPEIPAGWTRERYVGEPVAPETAYAISPQERYALEQGYMPPRVEVVQRAQVAPAVSAAQVAPEAQAQPAAPARRLETTPAVDSYFEEVTKNLPPRFRQIAAMEAQFQAQRRNELQQAANNIELANQAEHKRIERGIAQLPEDAGQYSGTVHNINRARAMADMNKELALAELSTRGMEPTAAAERMKSARETIKDKYADAITPFEKTEQYKAASQEATRISKDLQKQLKFTNEIGILKKYINEGKIDDAAKFAKATVAQSMNSLTSDNAIQTTEMLIRYPSLLSKFDLNKLQGKPALANLLSNIIEGTITKDKEQQLQDALSKDKGVLDQLIEYAARTNPRAFLKTAIDTANANTRSLNETMVNRIIRPTSPGIAHKLGIGELPQIAHLSEEENQPQQPMQQVAPAQENKFGSMKLPGGGVATWRSKK